MPRTTHAVHRLHECRPRLIGVFHRRGAALRAVVVVDIAGERLPVSDRAGPVFATIGVFAALPESWPRLRALSFALFMGTFGLVCAALALTPLHPAADGTLTIGGIAGFAGSGPMPWWARIVAGFFAIVCLGTAMLGVWGLLREFFGRRP